jgi:hypothetical protein
MEMQGGVVCGEWKVEGGEERGRAAYARRQEQARALGEVVSGARDAEASGGCYRGKDERIDLGLVLVYILGYL